MWFALLLLDNSEFYQNKCFDAGNNVLESWLRNCHSKYVMSSIDVAQIENIGPLLFLVPSETDQNTTYLMNMGLRQC